MHLLKINGSSVSNTDLEENILPPLQTIPLQQQQQQQQQPPLTITPQIQQSQLSPIQQPPLSSIEIRFNILKQIFINIVGFIVIMCLLFTLGVLVFLLVNSLL
jgi:hypothetical protein